MPVTRQQRVFYKTFSQHGSGTAMVEIEPKDVVLLIHIAYLDIFENEPDWFSEPFYQLAKESFYTITPEKVAELPGMTVEDAINLSLIHILQGNFQKDLRAAWVLIRQ